MVTVRWTRFGGISRSFHGALESVGSEIFGVVVSGWWQSHALPPSFRCLGSVIRVESFIRTRIRMDDVHSAVLAGCLDSTQRREEGAKRPTLDTV